MILGLVALPIAIAGASLSAESSSVNVERQFHRWERRLRSKIAERNIVSAATLDDPVCNVIVGFTVGEDRRPANVTVVKSSCDSFYNRRAQRLVRELGRVGQVPSRVAKNHRILLNLTYGSAANAVADRSLTNALNGEREGSLLRNLRIVTADAHMPATDLRGAE
jgi:hypothetical protein